MTQNQEKYVKQLTLLRTLEELTLNSPVEESRKYYCSIIAFKKLDGENISLTTNPAAVLNYAVPLYRRDIEKYANFTDAIIDTVVKEFKGKKIMVYQLISDIIDVNYSDHYTIVNRIKILAPVVLKFKKASVNGGLAEITTPYIEGDFDFTMDKHVTYDPAHMIPIKNISFPWCVEMQQDLSHLSEIDTVYEMLAEKLKQDFLKMIRTAPPIITDAPIPFAYPYNPPMKDGHIDAIFAMVETGEIEDGCPVIVSQVIYAPQMGVEYEWVNEECKIARKISKSTPTEDGTHD